MPNNIAAVTIGPFCNRPRGKSALVYETIIPGRAIASYSALAPWLKAIALPGVLMSDDVEFHSSTQLTQASDRTPISPRWSLYNVWQQSVIRLKGWIISLQGRKFNHLFLKLILTFWPKRWLFIYLTWIPWFWWSVPIIAHWSSLRWLQGTHPTGEKCSHYTLSSVSLAPL